jgi:hypothetical protein
MEAVGANASTDRVSDMAGIRSRKSKGSARVCGSTQSAVSPVFRPNSIGKTAMTPFRAGKMLALTDSSPHLWFSP